MEAKNNNFGFMRNERIKVPFFQRAYVWKKENWEKMYDDLRMYFDDNRQKNTYFLGSVILKRSTGSENFCDVIDGQQRLTTFSILLKSLYSQLKASSAQFLDYIYIQGYGEKVEPRITHSHLDKEKFDKVFNGEEIESNIEEGILGCFNYFQGRTKEDEIFKDDKTLYDFLKFITEGNMWVVINLDEKEDEQKIFDSINSSGVTLSVADIVKNALFDKILKLSSENNALEIYEKYWKEIFEKNDKEKSFWDKTINAGRVKRTRIEILLHAFALVKGIYDVNKSTLENLANNYKHHIKDRSLDDLVELLKELKQYAELYRNLPIVEKTTKFKFDDGEFRLLHIMEVRQLNTILPLILFLKAKLKDENEYKKCLKLLEILALCNKNTKDYNKIFATIIKELNGKVESDIYENLRVKLSNNYYKNFSKQNMIERLFKIENKDANLILFWIELYRLFKENGKADNDELEYSFTLEHLMPQTWETNWKDVGIDAEKAKKLIYQIGNMTLLKKKLNSQISNYIWNKKRDGIKNIKGAKLSITAEVLEKDEWNANTICERTEKLQKEFFEIWNVEIFNLD